MFPRLEHTLALLLVLYYSGAQKLEISPSEPQIQQFNSGAIFTCTLSEFDVYRGQNPVLRWKNNRGAWVPESIGRIYVERPHLGEIKLYIMNVEGKDAGLYQCQADVNGQTLIRETSLLIYEEIQFADTASHLQQVAGASPLLECRATGQPQPTVTWRFNRRKIPDQDSDKYRYETGGLRIFNINASDNGTYECRGEVQDQALFKVKTIDLTVLYPPIIERGPQEQEVIEGDELTLHCEAHGNPAPTYRWYMEVHLSDMAKWEVSLGEDPDSSISVPRVRSDQEGRYFCEVSNALGSVKTGADITVLVPPELLAPPDKRVAEGSTIIVPCQATGRPTPTISWVLDGSRREYDHTHPPNDARIRIDSAAAGLSKLVLYEATRAYSGIYTCVARSRAGMAQAASEVTIEYAPTTNVSSGDQVGWAGHVCVVTCTSRGLPRPSVSWLKGGEPLLNSSLYSVQQRDGAGPGETESQLRIRIPEQEARLVYGRYDCVGKNKHGDDTQAFVLYQAEAPVMPGIVRVLETSTEGVVLACASPRAQRVPILRWVLEYFPTEQPDNITSVQYDGSEEKFEIGGLASGTTYQVALAAVNAAGVGEAYKFVVRTQEALTNQEQSDIPIPGQEDNINTYADAKKGGVKVEQSQQGGDVASVANSPGAPQMSLAFILLLVALALVIFILLITTFAVCRRRRSRRASDGLNLRKVVEYGGTQTVHVTSDEDPDHMKLNIITHESYTEGKVTTLIRSPHSDRRANGGGGTGTGTLTRKHARKASEISGVGSGDGTLQGSEQARVWEDTLQRARNRISDADSEAFMNSSLCAGVAPGNCDVTRYGDLTLRSNPMNSSVHSAAALSENDWPPPPSPDTCTLARSGYNAKRACADVQSIHDVLDGYMSGDGGAADEICVGNNTHNLAYFNTSQKSAVTSPVSSLRSPVDLGRVPSDYEQSSYRHYDPLL